MWLKKHHLEPRFNTIQHTECAESWSLQQQFVHSRVAPPRGTEVDMMGVDRLLQSVTRGGGRAGSRWELPALLYSYNGLCRIYIYIYIYIYVSYLQSAQSVGKIFSKIFRLKIE